MCAVLFREPLLKALKGLSEEYYCITEPWDGRRDRQFCLHDLDQPTEDQGASRVGWVASEPTEWAYQLGWGSDQNVFSFRMILYIQARILRRFLLDLKYQRIRDNLLSRIVSH
jgi:hypothetical protein